MKQIKKYIIIVLIIIIALLGLLMFLNNTKFTICYEKNTLDMVNNFPDNQYKLYFSKTDITNVEPKRLGYSFDSWNTEPNGSGEKFTFKDIYTINENIILYAQWTEKKYNNPNEPVLGEGMKPICWDENNNPIIINDLDNKQSMWYSYSYSNSEFGIDYNSSKWANAITNDGSYWVWIPAYAYKITYYTDNTYNFLSKGKTIYGIIDIQFMNDYDEIDNDYMPHYAFSMNNGIKGFWVAKYEMSREDRIKGKWLQDVTNGNLVTNESIRMVSKPGVKPWVYISSSLIFSNSLNYNSNMKSHMMKNSEWGAVAYLTWSSYGRNGYEVTINNYYNDGLITGHGAKSINDTSTDIYSQYNTEQSIKASTTGNVYGIYDMSGGANEYVAAFIIDGEKNNLVNDINVNQYAGNLYIAGINNSEYVDVYYEENAYESHYGDAVYETLYWNNDHGRFPAEEFCVFKRGNTSDGTAFSGLFAFFGARGSYTLANSFRVVLWY